MNPELDFIRPNLTRAVQFYTHQMQRLLKAHSDAFPVYTRGGGWVVDLDGQISGYEGYLPGQLWILYRMTRDSWFRDMAERTTRALEPLKTERKAPHLGQIFLPSWKRWYDFSAEPVVNAVVIEAGRTLAKRFQPEGGYLPAASGESVLHIESLLDVPLLFHAARHTGDPYLLMAARSHVDTVRRCLLRGDGSTAEEALFEVDGGQFLRELHRAGWRSDSCWARGLASAIYGFTAVFAYTQNSRDLASADNCARFYIEHAPEHGVPPYDFDDPEPPARSTHPPPSWQAGVVGARQRRARLQPRLALPPVCPAHPRDAHFCRIPRLRRPWLGRPAQARRPRRRELHPGRLLPARNHLGSLQIRPVREIGITKGTEGNEG
jgi:unsaturated chondroitin disaccharide hydrolase